MKKFMTMLSLLFLAGIPATGMTAQDDNDTPEGLVSAYVRSYSYDQETLTAANEEADGDYDSAMMMSGIDIRGITFESNDHAVAYVDEGVSEMSALIDEDPDIFDHIQVDELEGFDTDGIRLTIPEEDTGTVISTIMIVHDNHVFQVFASDVELEAAEAKADEILQFILDAEIQSDDVSFNQNGTSTGGVFDRMPTAEDDVIGDFTTVTDRELNAYEYS